MTAETPTPIGAADIEALVERATQLAQTQHMVIGGSTLNVSLGKDVVRHVLEAAGVPALLADRDKWQPRAEEVLAKSMHNLGTFKDGVDAKDAEIARLTAERDQARAKAIEECARVAIDYAGEDHGHANTAVQHNVGAFIAERIRALEQEKAS